MSYADTILQAMRYDIAITPEDVSKITHLDEQEVKRIMKMLDKGGLIEMVSEEKYKRRKIRKYKSRQMGLPL